MDAPENLTAPDELQVGVALAAWPEPLVRMREATDDEIPAGVRRLLAVAHPDWTVRVMYACGTAPAAVDRWVPGELIESVVLYAWGPTPRADVRLLGSWERKLLGSKGFEFRRASCHPGVRLNATELRRALGVGP